MKLELYETEHIRTDGRPLPRSTEVGDIPFLRASDIREGASLTYRQLNNWELKGVLPNSRGNDATWRKFSPRDFFAILVCAQIRNKFQVPLESLQPLQSHLVSEEVDFLTKAIERIAGEGLSYYLLTDLQSYFHMISVLDLERGVFTDALGGDAHAAFILLKLNHLIDCTLSQWDKLPPLAVSTVVHNEIHTAQEQPMCDLEREVLRLVRDGSFDSLTIRRRNGKIVTAEAERMVPQKELKKILQILNSRDFQTVTVVRQNGHIVHIKQKFPIRFSSASD